MMTRTIRKLATLLTPREKKQAAVVLVMILIMALLEVAGVASIVPFMAVLANPQVVETNRHLAAAYEMSGIADPQGFLFLLGLVVFVALAASTAFKALTTYALLRFTNMRGYTLGRRLVAGYLEQPYEWFLNRNSAGLAQSVLSEVQQVISDALIPSMQLAANATVALALLLLLFLADPLLAVAVGFGLGVVYGAIYLLLRHFIGRIGADRVRANRERYKVLSEALGGIKEVKVSSLEKTFLNRFEGPAFRYARHYAASQAAAQLPRFVLEILAFGAILLVALYLMRTSGGLHSTLPMLALYAFAGYRLMPALQNVYADLLRLRFAESALDILHGDLTTLSKSEVRRDACEPMKLAEAIVLDGVSYRYPKAARAALDGVTIEIPARGLVGLVGQTGSGKTTTVDIILGLLVPTSGALRVDGELIAAENVRSWRRSVGYVPQQIFLSDDTVAANIAFGIPRERIDLAAVERAARIANLHDFVTNELPKGYDTMVGERGVRLSGGQRQRIGIARGLYHRPQVLVLDEATSALDNLTEKAVMEAMGNLGHEITIILIAHRLSTVRSCDRIYLLEKGRLAGQGAYDELVAGNKHFRRMAEAGAAS